MRVSRPAESPLKLGMPAAPLLKIHRAVESLALRRRWNTGRQVWVQANESTSARANQPRTVSRCAASRRCSWAKPQPDRDCAPPFTMSSMKFPTSARSVIGKAASSARCVRVETVRRRRRMRLKRSTSASPTPSGQPQPASSSVPAGSAASSRLHAAAQGGARQHLALHLREDGRVGIEPVEVAIEDEPRRHVRPGARTPPGRTGSAAGSCGQAGRSGARTPMD